MWERCNVVIKKIRTLFRLTLFKLGFDIYILKHAQECKVEHYEADLIPKGNPKWVQEKRPWNEAENADDFVKK